MGGGANHDGLYLKQGREGGPLLVLLHGLGAHGGVWRPMLETAASEWPGAWIAPDLRGHGRSAWADTYALDDHARDVAEVMRQAGGEDGAVILGHSMGGAVGLALASGRHGIRPARVIGLGVKAIWSPEETRWLSALAASPVRRFETREAAVARFLKTAGLTGLVDPDSKMAETGVVQDEAGWRLAADPATAMVGPPPMDELTAAAGCPVRLAAGEHDPMSRLEDLRRWDAGAAALPGLGHNAMVENPGSVWALVHGCSS